MNTIARASAPGGIGNFGPGLDIIGCAVTGLRDIVEARFTSRPGVHIEEAGHPDLSTDATLHASGIAASEVIARASQRGRTFANGALGVALRVIKQLPLSGGQGGSAALEGIVLARG